MDPPGPAGALPRGAPGYRGEAFLAEGAGAVRDLRVTPRRIEVTVEAAAPARLVINQNHAPGWSLVGPEAAVLERAPDGRLAVALPRGRSEVRLRYTPPGLGLGLLVLAMGGAGLAAVSRRRARRS